MTIQYFSQPDFAADTLYFKPAPWVVSPWGGDVVAVTNLGNGEFSLDVSVAGTVFVRAGAAPALGDLSLMDVDGSGSSGGGSVSITLSPVLGTAGQGATLGSPILLECFQYESKTFPLTVKDAAGNYVDLSSKALKFTVQDASSTPTLCFSVADADIQRNGGSNEIALITPSATDTDLPVDEYRWRLWDTGAPVVLLYGTLKIHPAVTLTP